MPRERLNRPEAVERFLAEAPELEGEGALAFAGDEEGLGFIIRNEEVRFVAVTASAAAMPAGPTRTNSLVVRQPGPGLAAA